ncbi:MAG: DNA polymerase III subunit beta [Gammaproteobacteria bacterium RIFCSPLOWO2_02_FULL_56_15]|nr:MAG: DNA polymerase III subunit beta [Gammaproteobacteria bacterium RIFCSPLOWO2_02_FULL_56_15]
MKEPNLEQSVVATISTQLEVQLVILFGSLATGKWDKESDLDIAVDAGRHLMVNEKISLIEKLAQQTGRPVDLVDIQSIGEPLLGQILRYGKRILGSDRHYARVLCRHLFDQADFLPYRNRILAERRQAWIGKL